MAVVLAFLAGIALLVVRRPAVGLPLALGIGILVPLQANALFTGIRYSEASAVYTVLPLTWVSVLAVPLAVLFVPRHLYPDAVRFPPYVLFVGAFGTLSALVAVLASTGAGKVFYAGTVAGPLAWFTAVRVGAAQGLGSSPDRPPSARPPLALLADVVVVVGLAEAVLALAQRLTQSSIVFGTQYRTETWYVPDAGAAYRSTGTMDHPLNLALLLIVVLGLLLRRSPTWWTLGGSVLVVGGVAASASRAGIVVAAGLMAAAAVSRRFGGVRRLAILAGLAAGAVLVLRSPVGEVLARRYTTDVSSLSIRSNAYAAFGRIWTDYLGVGHGPGTSYQVAEGLLFRQGSLESPWLMHAIDYGLPAVALLVAGIAVCVLTRGRSGYLDRTAFLAVAAMVSTYSSLSTASMSPYVFFTALALVVGEPVRPVDEATSRGPQVSAEPAATSTPSLRRNVRPGRRAAARPPVPATSPDGSEAVEAPVDASTVTSSTTSMPSRWPSVGP
jgi:hypothetical protein